jgi:hypothetical protein
MTTFPTRRPRVNPAPFTRPVKTAEFVELHAGAIGPMVLVIGGARVLKSYFLTPQESDFGRAFLLESRGDGKLYYVNLAGRNTSCDCDGFLWTGGCKHASALLDLAAKGRI